jgi:hypothetical protein
VSSFLTDRVHCAQADVLPKCEVCNSDAVVEFDDFVRRREGKGREGTGREGTGREDKYRPSLS